MSFTLVLVFPSSRISCGFFFSSVEYIHENARPHLLQPVQPDGISTRSRNASLAVLIDHSTPHNPYSKPVGASIRWRWSHRSPCSVPRLIMFHVRSWDWCAILKPQCSFFSRLLRPFPHRSNTFTHLSIHSLTALFSACISLPSTLLSTRSHTNYMTWVVGQPIYVWWAKLLGGLPLFSTTPVVFDLKRRHAQCQAWLPAPSRVPSFPINLEPPLQPHTLSTHLLRLIYVRFFRGDNQSLVHSRLRFSPVLRNQKISAPL